MYNILFVIEKKTYRYYVEYINSLKNFFNFDIIMVHDFDKIDLEKNDLIIFVQGINEKCKKTMEENNKKIFVLNTEQLTNAKKQIYIRNINNIVDYSIENIYYLNENFEKKNTFFFPYGYNGNEIYNFEKINDICIIGDSQRRQNIINLFNSNDLNLTHINKTFGLLRDENLFSHKILINVHYEYNYMIHESIRCDRCVFNKMIVISEKSQNNDKLLLKDFVIFVDYDKIFEKVKEVLENYDYYYKKIFIDGDFDNFIIKYREKLQTIYDGEIDKMIKMIKII